MRDQVDIIADHLKSLITIMTTMAETHVDILMAGYTHLQPAQPIRFSHWVMSHVAALLRDHQRLIEQKNRINICPLGSGALAGHAFGIDRYALATSLQFDDITLNSLDSVSDRDTIAEFMSWAALCMTHLSQFSEDLIIYNYTKCVSLSDAYATGSSLMPQKKNPDALELLRGKAGRILGNATGFLATLKGLPRSYNKDLQEDKEPLFDTIDTMTAVLQISQGLFATMEPIPLNLQAQLVPEMLATDLAEFLVRKGVPFRETHHIAGAAVKLAEDTNRPLHTLTCADLKPLHPLFGDDEEQIKKIFDYQTSVETRSSLGGTSKKSVLWQIERVRQYLEQSGNSN